MHSAEDPLSMVRRTKCASPLLIRTPFQVNGRVSSCLDFSFSLPLSRNRLWELPRHYKVRLESMRLSYSYTTCPYVF